MRSKDAISLEALNRLLDWLDPERDEAGKKYEVIRRALIQIFINSGCIDGEGLADMAIDRVSEKVAEVRDTYKGDPALYFYGFAHNIRLEYHNTRREDNIDNIDVEDPGEIVNVSTPDQECLDKCLGRLSKEQREFILEYHSYKGSEKIERHREMAKELGIEVNTLRLRAHRIRNILANCVKNCLNSQNK